MEKKKGLFLCVIMILSVVGFAPAILLGDDSAPASCSEAEVVNKQNVCEPIIVSNDRGLRCPPEGYSLEVSDEKRPGAVQVNNYFYRCIPTPTGAPKYIGSMTKKHDTGTISRNTWVAICAIKHCPQCFRRGEIPDECK